MEFEFEEKSEDGSQKMDQESKSGYLVDTTDCLEAISVIRCWKNFLFIIIIVCLLLLQGLFWVVNLNDVENDEPWAVAAANAQHLPQAGEPAFGEVSPTGGPAAVKIPEKIKQAAKQAAQEANAPARLEQQPEEGVIESPPSGIRFSFAPKMEHVVVLVRFLNFILIPASVIYCLTMLFAFKVSLIGRLGGIRFAPAVAASKWKLPNRGSNQNPAAMAPTIAPSVFHA